MILFILVINKFEEERISIQLIVLDRTICVSFLMMIIFLRTTSSGSIHSLIAKRNREITNYSNEKHRSSNLSGNALLSNERKVLKKNLHFSVSLQFFHDFFHVRRPPRSISSIMLLTITLSINSISNSSGYIRNEQLK